MKEVGVVKEMCGGGAGDPKGEGDRVRERERKNAEVHINACKTAGFHLDSGSQSVNSCIALFLGFCTWSKSLATQKAR